MTADTNSYQVVGDEMPYPSAWHAGESPRDARVPRKCEPVLSMPPAARMSTDPTPIWLAALIASRCLAMAEGGGHAVRWDHVSGRALYTNSGSATETIEPLGVSLQEGHTLAVSWIPGETAYTVEVFRQYDLCA